eukprot:1143869-Pelagomonas_calceolata.AAC.3
MKQEDCTERLRRLGTSAVAAEGAQIAADAAPVSLSGDGRAGPSRACTSIKVQQVGQENGRLGWPGLLSATVQHKQDANMRGWEGRTKRSLHKQRGAAARSNERVVRTPQRQLCNISTVSL